jgi:HD-like signal output (HDOD) protein
MKVSAEYNLSHDELQQTLASIEIPACPAVVTQVMAEAQKDAPDLNVLTRIIVADVGMSAFAIKLANSTLFRRGQATSSVSQALSRLGTRNIVCIVVAVALRNTMSGDIPADVLDRFWNQASASLRRPVRWRAGCAALPPIWPIPMVCFTTRRCR